MFYTQPATNVDHLFRNKHKGESIYFLNTGPSLNDYDLSQLAGKHTYSIKNIPLTHINTEYWSCFEKNKNNPPKVLVKEETWKIPNTKIVAHDVYQIKYKVPNTYFVVVKDGQHYSPKTFLTNDYVAWGLSKHYRCKDGFQGRRSIFIGIFPILSFMGFEKVYLLGVDFEMKKEKPYADDREKSDDACHENMLLYEALQARCKHLNKIFKRSGMTVYNCNKDSKLTAFPYMDFEETLNDPKLQIS